MIDEMAQEIKTASRSNIKKVIEKAIKHTSEMPENEQIRFWSSLIVKSNDNLKDNPSL
mgnify:CR=1 FL=1